MNQDKRRRTYCLIRNSSKGSTTKTSLKKEIEVQSPLDLTLPTLGVWLTEFVEA
jgi:hypothetical protein